MDQGGAGTNGRARRCRGRLMGASALGKSDQYRSKAIEFLWLASRASDEKARIELLNLAVSYARLADHAEQERNIDEPSLRSV